MKDINEINTENIEGRLLLSAIAIISTELETNSTPDEILRRIEILSYGMFE